MLNKNPFAHHDHNTDGMNTFNTRIQGKTLKWTLEKGWRLSRFPRTVLTILCERKKVIK